MAGQKTTRHAELRKTPKVEILRLAQQLHEDARRSRSHVDAVVADLVSCAWLFDTRLGRGAGSRALAHAARALLATVDGNHPAERATPRSLPSPGDWWESLQRFALIRVSDAAPSRFERLQQVRSATPRQRSAIHLLVARAMVEHAIAAVPGIDVERDGAVARLLGRLHKRAPKDAPELARWTLTACGVEGNRANAAAGASRMKKLRTSAK